MNSRVLISFAVMLILGATLARPQESPKEQRHGSPVAPANGTIAPDFTLKYFDGSNLKDVKLSDYRGKKNVVVAFYVFAFTGG